MVEALIGGADGIDKAQRSLIDRAVTQLYREHHEKPDRPAPTLVDLTERLNRLEEPEAVDAARALEIYATGSLDAFAHPTNVDFLLLMNQNPTDADALCDLLKLSDEQRGFFTGVQPGQGMAKSGTAFIPFDGRLDTGSLLYQLYTTKFEDQHP